MGLIQISNGTKQKVKNNRILNNKKIRIFSSLFFFFLFLVFLKWLSFIIYFSLNIFPVEKGSRPWSQKISIFSII